MLTRYKLMWANNGDCVSRQYTGTAAMKVSEREINRMKLVIVLALCREI